MNQESRKITEFTDLISWKKSHELVIFVYRITEKFPQKEVFGITSQMRRAAVSITSNIAEGFGRQSYKEKIQFYYISHGSLTELKNQFFIAKDVGFINEKDFIELMNKANESHKLLQGLITKSKTFV